MSSCLQSIGYGSDCLNAGVPNGTKLIGGTIKALKRRRRSEESSIRTTSYSHIETCCLPYLSWLVSVCGNSDRYERCHLSRGRRLTIALYVIAKVKSSS